MDDLTKDINFLLRNRRKFELQNVSLNFKGKNMKVEKKILLSHALKIVEVLYFAFLPLNGVILENHLLVAKSVMNFSTYCPCFNISCNSGSSDDGEWLNLILCTLVAFRRKTSGSKIKKEFPSKPRSNEPLTQYAELKPDAAASLLLLYV